MRDKCGQHSVYTNQDVTRYLFHRMWRVYGIFVQFVICSAVCILQVGRNLGPWDCTLFDQMSMRIGWERRKCRRKYQRHANTAVTRTAEGHIPSFCGENRQPVAGTDGLCLAGLVSCIAIRSAGHTGYCRLRAKQSQKMIFTCQHWCFLPYVTHTISLSQ